MYDQSFSKKTLARVLQKRDFNHVPTASRDIYRDGILDKALAAALSNFNSPNLLLSVFQLFKKNVYRLSNIENELVARKLTQNLKRFVNQPKEGRTQIVSNMALLLSEGVPYRVYRLDVRSFYESFNQTEVVGALHGLQHLSPQTKNLIEILLDSHADMGGTGVPRGLSLSAILSNLLMRDFDLLIQSHEDTFYYSRYVDDIVIITSTRETPRRIIAEVKKALPTGLELNPNKRQIVDAKKKVSPVKASNSNSPKFKFDYLGYSFLIRDPVKQNDKPKNGEYHRDVIVDIAQSKVKKHKTRIVRSFLDFSCNRDWSLLQDRIAFLSQNFSVHNPKAGEKKLAGIFHSYPLLTNEAVALLELDRFLRNTVLSKNGRSIAKTAGLLNATQRRQLLKYSFVRGHANKTFVHFHPTRISAIQNCWVN